MTPHVIRTLPLPPPRLATPACSPRACAPRCSSGAPPSLRPSPPARTVPRAARHRTPQSRRMHQSLRKPWRPWRWVEGRGGHRRWTPPNRAGHTINATTTITTTTTTMTSTTAPNHRHHSHAPTRAPHPCRCLCWHQQRWRPALPASRAQCRRGRRRGLWGRRLLHPLRLQVPRPAISSPADTVSGCMAVLPQLCVWHCVHPVPRHDRAPVPPSRPCLDAHSLMYPPAHMALALALVRQPGATIVGITSTNTPDPIPTACSHQQKPCTPPKTQTLNPEPRSTT